MYDTYCSLNGSYYIWEITGNVLVYVLDLFNGFIYTEVPIHLDPIVGR